MTTRSQCDPLGSFDHTTDGHFQLKSGHFGFQSKLGFQSTLKQLFAGRNPMSNDSIVILNGARTPMGGFQGSLSSVTAPQLGAVAIREAISRALPQTAGTFRK